MNTKTVFLIHKIYNFILNKNFLVTCRYQSQKILSTMPSNCRILTSSNNDSNISYLENATIGINISSARSSLTSKAITTSLSVEGKLLQYFQTALIFGMEKLLFQLQRQLDVPSRSSCSSGIQIILIQSVTLTNQLHQMSKKCLKLIEAAKPNPLIRSWLRVRLKDRSS